MSDWLIQRFSDYAERPFLAQGEDIFTYSHLTQLIHEYCKTFTQQGICAGDVVTLETDYSSTAVAALFALFKLKTIVAPITAVSDTELKLRRTVATARWSLRLNSQPGTLPEFIPHDKTDQPHTLIGQLAEASRAGLILFSSGSTGTPKAMVHDVERLLSTFSKKARTAAPHPDYPLVRSHWWPEHLIQRSGQWRIDCSTSVKRKYCYR